MDRNWVTLEGEINLLVKEQRLVGEKTKVGVVQKKRTIWNLINTILGNCFKFSFS